MKFKHFTAFVLAVCLCLCIMPGIGAKAADELHMSDYEIVRKMDELFDLIGNKYFTVTLGPACGAKHKNHSCENCLTNNIVKSEWFIGMFGDGITVDLFPRTYTSSGSFGGAAYSCAGFATFLEWYIFRQSRTAKVETVRIGRYMYNAENVAENVQIGDLIRLNNAGHSFIVYDYDDTGITVLDSNWGAEYNCLIQKHVIKYAPYSGNSFTISRVLHTNDHALSVKYSANGGAIDSQIKGDRYRVASSTGLNMRTGPGLSYDIIKLFPYGKVFDTYYKDDPVKADGYTWVRSVIDGNDGWLAVSKTSLAEFVCRIRSTEYYVGEDGMICSSAEGEQYKQLLEFGVDYETELPGAEELGVYREGFVFRGWAAEKDGTVPINTGETLSADDLVDPDDISVTDITLYAVWKRGYGDCNGDGNVDGRDLIRLRRYLLSVEAEKPAVSVGTGADCNGDGEIDGRDLIRLRKYLAGYNDETGESDFALGPD